MKPYIKNILKYVGVILLFLVVAYAFVPEVISGKIVNQVDITGYQGMSHEMNEWNKANPDNETEWTNSMFGGMPTTTFAAHRHGDWLQPAYDLLLLGKRPATYLFISLLGAFLLLLSLGADVLIAIGGAIAVSFCSYNMQIIQVGHNTKMQAIAFLPWALAAFVFTYRVALGQMKLSKGKSWRTWLPFTVLGSALFACAVSFQVKANHQQITYYLGLMLVLYAIVLFVWLVADKERRAMIGRFFAASALLLTIGLAGVATNTNKLLPVYKYTMQSMRGGSELASASNSESGGLEVDYATEWSYGWEELPNLMIANYNGGASNGAVNIKNSATYDLLVNAGQTNARDLCKSLPLYWGPQPFTAGPMYMGAITIFLFIMGLMLCEGKDKWWLIVTTILAILLGVGRNFMWFTKLFYDYMPLYNKFRTVSMALIILQVTLPVLGFISLDKILKGGVAPKDFKKASTIAAAITAGFCLLVTIVPSLAGSFISASDASNPQYLTEALWIDRRHIFVMDALRSFVLIMASYIILLWGYAQPKQEQKEEAQNVADENPDAVAEADPASVAPGETNRSRRVVAIVCVSVLVLADLFSVGKRYLNSNHFIYPRTFKAQFDKTPVDEEILQDTDLSYRVLDLSSNTFSDARTPYWHKSIGGYSPAKLQRYQELITNVLQPEIEEFYRAAGNAETVSGLQQAVGRLQMLSALNMKYAIIAQDLYPYVNPYANGNAWFVDGQIPVSSPDEALDTVGHVDLTAHAIFEPKDQEALAGAVKLFGAIGEASEADEITLTSYAPNELHYHYSISEPRLVVFSEVFYPDGWTAWLNDGGVKGEDVPVFRADWILRSAVLPAGEHDLVMRFDMKVSHVGTRVSRLTSISVILLLLLSAAACCYCLKKKDEPETTE